MPFDTDALKSRLDLADYVTSRGFQLIKRGQGLVMPCPFHKEEKPSFTVSPKRQLFHCFGCGITGDILTFVERLDGIDFNEAASRLFHLANLKPQPKRPEKTKAPRVSSAEARVLSRRLLEDVSTYYQRTLEENKTAQEFLTTRGLTNGALLTRFRLGFADGSLAPRVKKQPVFAAQLTARGILNKRGNEFFHGCVVFPIGDGSGQIVNLYGRNTRTPTDIPHLYLTGPRVGVFNPPGLKGSGGTIILTEGLIDALSLIQLGFVNTTCTWGVNGFSADLMAALQRHRVTTVFVTYDDDRAGNTASEQLARRLGPHGIQTRRVLLPTKDPNDFLVEGHTADEFRALMDAAADLTPEDYRPKHKGKARPPSPPPTPATPMMEAPSADGPPSTAPSGPTAPAAPAHELPPSHIAEAPPESPGPMGAHELPAAVPIDVPQESPATAGPARAELVGEQSSPPVPPNTIVTRFGPRLYKITLPRPGSMGLRVTLRLEADGKYLLDRFDLASDRSRSAFVSKAERLFPAFERSHLEEDLFHLIDQIEQQQVKREEPATLLTPKVPPMSEAEERVARAFLESPKLFELLVVDLEGVGLVGETFNKLLLYLIATSRLLDKPLSGVLLSGSSAGKSHVIKGVAGLIPPECVFSYTRISAQALFYKEREALKHKLIVIEEAEGASDADYPLRVMQSDRVLTNLVTVKDPVTGLMTTQESEVEGPISLLVSSTAAAIHYENATRSFELSIDESVEQTEKILTAQREANTWDGLVAKTKADSIRARHHNAQRLLAPMDVANNYARLLSFPASPLRLRREHDKYLSLIAAVTFFHQHQRTQKPLPAGADGEPRPCILTRRADIKIANRLFAAIFADTVGELSRQSRTLLGHIQELLEKKTKEAHAHPESNASSTPNTAEPLFEPLGITRREIREAINWSDYQLKICLDQLEGLEYVVTTNGKQGKRYVYALTPKGQHASGTGCDPDELARQLGLTDPDTLPDLDE